MRALLLREEFDTLINNAGITRIDFIQKHSMKDFCEVVHLNLTVPFFLCREFIRWVATVAPEEYEEGHHALIVNTSSMATSIALRASPGYCASKAGLEAMTKVLAKELAGTLPVACVCIAPGGVDDTQMVRQVTEDLQRTRGMTKEQAEAYNRQSPLRRNMTHDEVWKMFDFAVNSMPLYMTGTVLRATGGMGV